MPSTPNQPEDKFLEANNYWNLEELYIDLAESNGRKRITPKQKEFLRGILLYHSPGEIAKISCCGVDWVKQALGQLYPIIENLLNLPDKTCRVYSKVPFLLNKYQLANNNQSPNSSQLAQIWEASQETQQQEQPVTTCSDNQSWQTLEDAMPYLEIFYHHCELEQYIQAFYTIFDGDNYENCVYNFLSLSGYIHEIVNLYERLLQSWQAKVKEEEKWEFGVSHAYLGHAYAELKQHQKAIDCYQQWLKNAGKIGDINGKALCLIHLGSVYHSLEQYPKAIEYNRRGLKIARKIGNRVIEANALNNLGIIYSPQQQYYLALDYHHHSLVISNKTGDAKNEVQSLLYIGKIHRDLGEYQESVLFLQQGIEIAHQSGNRKLKANIAEHLLLTLIRLEKQSVQHLEAIAAYKKAHELFQDIGLDNYAEMCNAGI